MASTYPAGGDTSARTRLTPERMPQLNDPSLAVRPCWCQSPCTSATLTPSDATRMPSSSTATKMIVAPESVLGAVDTMNRQDGAAKQDGGQESPGRGDERIRGTPRTPPLGSVGAGEATKACAESASDLKVPIPARASAARRGPRARRHRSGAGCGRRRLAQGWSARTCASTANASVTRSSTASGRAKRLAELQISVTSSCPQGQP